VPCLQRHRRTDLLGEASIRHRPLCGRTGQGAGRGVGVAEREDGFDLATQGRSVEALQLSDQRQVDEILGAGARAPALVATRVGVELFGDLQLQRDGVDLDRNYVREPEEVAGLENLRGQRVIGSEADIEGKVSNSRPARDAVTRKR